MVSAVKIEQNLSQNITMMTQLFLSYHHGAFSSIFFFENNSDYHGPKCEKSKIRISSHLGHP